MAERGSAFNDFSCIDSSYIYAQEIEKAFFFQRMRLMSPEMKRMQRNVVMQELVLHVERRCVLAKELENLAGP